MKPASSKNDLMQLKNNFVRIFRELFHRIDVNDDGTIDFNEFLVLIAIRNQSGNIEDRLAFVFDLFVFIRSYVFINYLFILAGMNPKMDKSIEKN